MIHKMAGNPKEEGEPMKRKLWCEVEAEMFATAKKIMEGKVNDVPLTTSQVMMGCLAFYVKSEKEGAMTAPA